MLNTIRDFIRLEAAGGILLMMAAALAILVANSPLSVYYDLFIDTPVEIRVGPLEIAKPLLLWINDGLMAVFFFLIGLELKREALEGELSDLRKAALPAIGALGGMIVPAAIYAWINRADPVALQGWAIPAATDIAFALGVLSLLGERVPLSLKVFLTTVAIFDDIGAIVIIALFYTANLSVTGLVVAGLCLGLLYVLNRRGTSEVPPYLFVGLVMWVALLKSGVHATLAGVLLAFFIPMKHSDEDKGSPLKTLEHDLHGVVAFAVLPLFAFANSGLDMRGMAADAIFHPVPIGILLGLFIGKQIGVFGFCLLAVKTGIARLPEGLGYLSLYGVSLLCGIGFTMSIFIGSLAFEETQVNLLFDERLGIIAGSLVSGLLAYIVLNKALPRKA